MYGTVARMRLKVGAAAQMAALMQDYDQVAIPGMIATYVYQADTDPQEFYLATVFDSKDAYVANAGSPEQHARYLKLRDLLESEPEWHDGVVVYSWSQRS